MCNKCCDIFSQRYPNTPFRYPLPMILKRTCEQQSQRVFQMGSLCSWGWFLTMELSGMVRRGIRLERLATGGWRPRAARVAYMSIVKIGFGLHLFWATAQK